MPGEHHRDEHARDLMDGEPLGSVGVVDRHEQVEHVAGAVEEGGLEALEPEEKVTLRQSEILAEETVPFEGARAGREQSFAFLKADFADVTAFAIPELGIGLRRDRPDGNAELVGENIVQHHVAEAVLAIDEDGQWIEGDFAPGFRRGFAETDAQSGAGVGKFALDAGFI